MLKKTLVIILSLFMLTICSPIILAEDFTKPAIEKINPHDSISYTLKRLKEKIVFRFKFSTDSKIKYYKKLLSIRFSELFLVIENKEAANIEKSSQRYETTAGLLTDEILKSALNAEKEVVMKMFSEHSKILENIKTKYEYDTAERRLVQNDINSLKIYFDKLK